MTLAEQSFTPCPKGIAELSVADLREAMVQLPDWQLVTQDKIRQLQKRFNFTDFAQALAFANKVGALAQQNNHHPTLLIEWGAVTVSWWSHTINGLHQGDLIMAAKTDAL